MNVSRLGGSSRRVDHDTTVGAAVAVRHVPQRSRAIMAHIRQRGSCFGWVLTHVGSWKHRVQQTWEQSYNLSANTMQYGVVRGVDHSVTCTFDTRLRGGLRTTHSRGGEISPINHTFYKPGITKF